MSPPTGGGLRVVHIGIAVAVVLAVGIAGTVALLSRGQTDASEDENQTEKSDRREVAAISAAARRHVARAGRRVCDGRRQ